MGVLICTNFTLCVRAILKFHPLKTHRRVGKLAPLRFALLFDTIWTGLLLHKHPSPAILHASLLGVMSTLKKPSLLFALSIGLLILRLCWCALENTAFPLLLTSAYMITACVTDSVPGA